MRGKPGREKRGAGPRVRRVWASSNGAGPPPPPGTHCSGGSRAHSGYPGWVGSAGYKSAADTVGCRNDGSARASGWSPAASPGAYRRGTGQPEGVDRMVSPTSLKNVLSPLPLRRSPPRCSPWEARPGGAPSLEISPLPAARATATPPPPHPLPCSTTAGTCSYSPRCRSPRCCRPAAR